MANRNSFALNDSDDNAPYEAINGMDFSSVPPAKKWVIQNIIPEGITLLYGDSQVGKSFVALDMAGAIITGSPWLGKYAARRGMVAYLSLEGDIRPRWNAWQREHGVLITDREKKSLQQQFESGEAFEESLYEAHRAAGGTDDDIEVSSADEDKIERLRAKDAKDYAQALRRFPAANFSVFNQGVTLVEKSSVQRLIDGIKQQLLLFEKAPPLVLIVVDTVSQTMQGLEDENTQAGMQTLLRGVTHLRRQFNPMPSVLLLHHTPGSDNNKPRGSNVLPDDVDASFDLRILDKVSPKASSVPLLLKNRKMREGQAIEEVWLTKREISLTAGADEEAAIFADENAIRVRAGLAPLGKLDPRLSCVIEETVGGSVGPVDSHAAPPARSAGTKGPQLGKNAKALMDALRAQPGGQFPSKAAWREAAGVLEGSLHKATQEVLAANLVVVENGAVRLQQPNALAA